jgi:exodeoxyribonuclease VII small subunit
MQGPKRPKIAVLPPESDAMPKATATPASPAVPASYEAALAELESLVSRLESGDMPLEQLLTGYKRGAELLAFCRERLEAVENQIKVLDEGTLKTWTPE